MASAGKKKYILTIKKLGGVREKQMWEKNWLDVFISVLPNFHMCSYFTITLRDRVFCVSTLPHVLINSLRND